MTDDREQAARRELYQFAERWAAAESRMDASALDEMAAEDLRLVGPLGFVLDKEQWLYRYRSGDLVNKSFAWDDVQIRVHGQVAVAIGIQTQDSAYRGNPSAGRFRVTQTLLKQDGAWKLLSIHLSPIAQPG
jgi:ketosteroid isomerase-like protein